MPQSLEPWLGLTGAETAPPSGLGGVRVGLNELQGSLYASCRYLLRAILAGVDGAESDVTDAVILSAVMDINIGYLDDIPELSWRHATYAMGPPDGYRRPTSVNAVAERLGLPHETTRRRIERLIAQGRCVRTERGIHAPLLDSPQHRAGSQANYLAVRTLLQDLQRRIPEIAWPRVESFQMQSDDPPMRLVNRRCATYAVDTLAAISALTGGYDEALVYMGMVESTGRGLSDGAWPAVRASSLARSLDLPIPSVRRRLHNLMDRGLISARGAGFDARPAPEMEVETPRLAVANLRRLHAFFERLERLEAARQPGPSPKPAFSTGRAVYDTAFLPQLGEKPLR